jgi:hypothetical protein
MVNRKLILTVLAGAGLLLVLGACTPTCTVEQLQAPVGLDPDGEWNVLDLTGPFPGNLVTFTWGYPITTCEPDFFEMYVWTGLEPDSPGMTGRVDYADEISPGSWRLQWPVPLEPGNTYYWRQAACLEIGPGDDPCGPSTVGHFFTGPECTASDEMQPVELISPADDATFSVTDDVTFAWDDPTPCLVSYMFWIQISETPDFSEFLRRIPLLQSVWTVPGDEIPLEECHRYYWRIQTDPAGTPEEPYSDVRSFYVQSPGTLCAMAITPPPIVTLGAPPIATLPVEPIATLPVEPSAKVPQDTNCRAGPSTRYRVDDTLFAGVEAPIQGRNADASWIQILSPNLQRLCWIWAGQPGIEILGELGPLPVVYVAPPPEPTETPVDCAQYDQKTCPTISACKWYQPVVGGPGTCVDD